MMNQVGANGEIAVVRMEIRTGREGAKREKEKGYRVRSGRRGERREKEKSVVLALVGAVIVLGY